MDEHEKKIELIKLTSAPPATSGRVGPHPDRPPCAAHFPLPKPALPVSSQRPQDTNLVLLLRKGEGAMHVPEGAGPFRVAA
jgi:hypothetical protein